MSLLDTLRAGIKIADTVTKPLQPLVTYERGLTTNAYGQYQYAAPVSLRAIVEWKQQEVRSAAGIMVSSRITVLFLDIAALAAATGGEGIKTDDRITLPKGETGPIVSLGGFLDAGTGEPIPSEVFLG